MLSTRISLTLTICFGFIYCYLEIIPEKIDIQYTHPDYFANVTARVRRYGRNSPYYIVASGYLKRTWNNNVTVHVDTYEYLHNEYRLSFMTIHKKYCDLVSTDILMGSILRAIGLTCPTYSGMIEIKNATFKWDNFPYEFPLQRGMANITVRQSTTEELLFWFKLYANVKQHRSLKP